MRDPEGESIWGMIGRIKKWKNQDTYPWLPVFYDADHKSQSLWPSTTFIFTSPFLTADLISTLWLNYSHPKCLVWEVEGGKERKRGQAEQNTNDKLFTCFRFRRRIKLTIRKTTRYKCRPLWNVLHYPESWKRRNPDAENDATIPVASWQGYPQ